MLLSTCPYSSLVDAQVQPPEGAEFGASQQDEQLGATKNQTTDRTPLKNYWSMEPDCTQNSESTQEYCLFTSSTFAGDRGISIVTSQDHADEFTRIPAFADLGVHHDLGVNHLLNPPFVARQVQDHGIGLVTNRTITRGEGLMSFTPAFMMPHATYEDLASHERLKLQRLAFERLPDRLRNLSEDLFGRSDAEDLIDDIIILNSFGFYITTGDRFVGDWNPQNLYRILFPEISRFNHACRPSAEFFFDGQTLTLHVVAARDIFPGEELTISYITPLQRRRARLRALKRSWGFRCDCSLCAAPPEVSGASDARISELIELQRELEDYTDASEATPAMAERYISLLKQERLWTVLHGAYVVAAHEYNGVGDVPKAQMYARLALRSGLICRGPYNSRDDYRNMDALLRDPRSHSSYMFRANDICIA